LEKVGGGNKCGAAIVMCGVFCIKWLEGICDYINGTAFAYMAVTGDSFCTSAW